MEGKVINAIEYLDLNGNLSNFVPEELKLPRALCKNDLFSFNSNLYSVGGYDLFYNQPIVQAIDILNRNSMET